MANLREFLPYHDSRHPLLYGAAHFIVGQYLKYEYDLQIYGVSNLEQAEPRVYVPTHTEALDPAVLGLSAMNKAIPTMAKEELWTEERYRKMGVQLGKVLAIVDAFPVKRGKNDSSSYRTADNHLKLGRSVGLFAQGTRSLDFENLFDGAPRLAYRNNVPIQPLVIATHRSDLEKSSIKLIRVIAPRPLIPDTTLPKDEAVGLLSGQLSRIFKRDYPRALNWAIFDAARMETQPKKIGRIKRYA